MEIFELRYFMAVAQRESVSRAAEDVHVSRLLEQGRRAPGARAAHDLFFKSAAASASPPRASCSRSALPSCSKWRRTPDSSSRARARAPESRDQLGRGAPGVLRRRARQKGRRALPAGPLAVPDPPRAESRRTGPRRRGASGADHDRSAPGVLSKVWRRSSSRPARRRGIPSSSASTPAGRFRFPPSSSTRSSPRTPHPGPDRQVLVRRRWRDDKFLGGSSTRPTASN